MSENQGMIEASSGGKQIRRVYDLWSWGYDFFAGPFEQSAAKAAFEKAAIKSGDQVLEVAVGTGTTLLRIAQRIGVEGGISGVDLSPKMLAKSRRRLARAGFHQIHLYEADARHLPFHENAFDVLFNSYMLDLVPLADLPLVLAEFFRVLKPGGRLVLANFSKPDANRRTWWERLYQRLPKSWAGYLLGGCRPVLIQPLAEKVGFTEISREFRSSVILPTEIITARKPAG